MKLLRHTIFSSWLWLVPLLALWFSLFLGNRPFATPDEGRYVEIPREMVTTGDYVTPRLNGIKYFEKPPLFYWIQSLNIQLFGTQEAAMRIACVMFALIGCLATYLVGRRFYGTDPGLAASLILASSPLYYALSRLIILDMAVTTLVTLSLFSFLVAVHTSPGHQRRLWAMAFYSFLALGVLTKGLMALAIPGPVILIWAISTGRWKDLWPAYIPSGALLFLSIAAPWHILASLRNPEFFYKYFIVEHFLRYTTSMHMRSQHFLFFVPVLLLGLFPWISLLWNAVRDSLQAPVEKYQKGVSLFLLIWAGWTFGFFSISNSKLVPYILPCFPPLALILGGYWVKIRQPNFANAARQCILTFAGMSAVLSLGGIIALGIKPQLIDHKPHLWIDFIVLSCSYLFLGALALFFLNKNRIKLALNMVPIGALIIVASVIRLMPELQRPSIKPLAQIIQTHKSSGDIIGSYKTYYQDLPVYLNQIVTVVDMRGELDFGCEVEDCSQWMLDENKFLNLWESQKRVFILARSKEVENLVMRVPKFHYIPLGSDHGNILITNKR